MDPIFFWAVGIVALLVLNVGRSVRDLQRQTAKNFDSITEQLDNLRRYLYEIDPQFDDERECKSRLARAGGDISFGFAAMEQISLLRSKRESGKRTLDCTFLDNPYEMERRASESVGDLADE
jgi:hypothetical protein